MIDVNTNIKLDSNLDDYEEQDYLWQFKFRRNNKKGCIGGELILPSELLKDIENVEIVTVEKYLNSGLIYDFGIRFKNNDQLGLLINYKTGLGTVLGFKYLDGKWEYNRDKVYYWEGIDH